jgi:hypothetical protein
MPYFNPNPENTYYSKPGLMGGGNPMAPNGMGSQYAGYDPYNTMYQPNQQNNYMHQPPFNPYLTGTMNPNSSTGMQTPMIQGAGPAQGANLTQGGTGNNFSPWGNAISQLISAFGQSRGHYNDPSDAANKYLEQIGGAVGPYFDPYISAGKKTLADLMGQYGNLLSDPGALMNKFGQSFQESPGYKFNVDQALGAANRASAAGGMLGSPQQQQNLARTVTGLANQDYGNWMDRALGLYGRGLSGEEGINQMGFNASSQMAQALMDQLMSQASNAYAGGANRNQYEQDKNTGVWDSIAHAIGGLIPGPHI